jgi:hypothetical protein
MSGKIRILKTNFPLADTNTMMRSQYEGSETTAGSEVPNSLPEVVNPASDPDPERSALLRQVAKQDFGDSDASALESLVSRPRYLARLVDPALLTLADAQRAAQRLYKADPHFLSHFPSLSNSTQPASEEKLLRALELLDFLGEYRALLFWLRGLYNSPQPKVQSKAAKLFYRLRQSSDLLSESLVVLDDRIRANAVEALWKSDVPWAGAVFQQALHDPATRVVMNALIGLYYLNDSTVYGRLSMLSRHSSPQVRAAVVWVLHKLASPPLLDQRAKRLLLRMSDDPDEMVQGKFEKAVRSLDQTDNQ